MHGTGFFSNRYSVHANGRRTNAKDMNIAMSIIERSGTIRLPLPQRPVVSPAPRFSCQAASGDDVFFAGRKPRSTQAEDTGSDVRGPRKSLSFNDPVRAYMQSIGEYPLLPPAKVLAHARQVTQGYNGLALLMLKNLREQVQAGRLSNPAYAKKELGQMVRDAEKRFQYLFEAVYQKRTAAADAVLRTLNEVERTLNKAELQMSPKSEIRKAIQVLQPRLALQKDGVFLPLSAKEAKLSAKLLGGLQKLNQKEENPRLETLIDRLGTRLETLASYDGDKRPGVMAEMNTTLHKLVSLVAPETAELIGAPEDSYTPAVLTKLVGYFSGYDPEAASESVKTKEAEKLLALFNEPEREEACRLAREIEESQDVIANSNLRLVVSIAKKYQHTQVPLLDLIEEGNIGLMNAITKFDPTFGYNFTTYASWWITQAITRGAVDKRHLVRVPVHREAELSQIRNFTDEFLIENGCDPTVEDVANGLNMPEERIEELFKIAQGMYSLDSGMLDDEDGRSPLKHRLADQRENTELEMQDALDDQQNLALMMKFLPARFREILTARYGLDGYGSMRTLEEVGQQFGITRERVRQLEKKAIEKMRDRFQHHKAFQDYLP